MAFSHQHKLDIMCILLRVLGFHTGFSMDWSENVGSYDFTKLPHYYHGSATSRRYEWIECSDNNMKASICKFIQAGLPSSTP